MIIQVGAVGFKCCVAVTVHHILQGHRSVAVQCELVEQKAWSVPLKYEGVSSASARWFVISLVLTETLWHHSVMLGRRPVSSSPGVLTFTLSCFHSEGVSAAHLWICWRSGNELSFFFLSRAPDMISIMIPVPISVGSDEQLYRPQQRSEIPFEERCSIIFTFHVSSHTKES